VDDPAILGGLVLMGVGMIMMILAACLPDPATPEP
jgi:hypothetical protein